MYRSSFGFTLIELLVVVAIIGVLTSVILVSLNHSRINSQNTTTVANVNQLIRGLELYFAAYGTYPASNSWDCVLEDSDEDGECWNGNSTFSYSNNSADVNSLLNYVDYLSMPSYTDHNPQIEGAVYRQYGDGYRLLYALQGRNQVCPLGVFVHGDLDSSGNTACDVCYNTSAGPCP